MAKKRKSSRQNSDSMNLPQDEPVLALMGNKMDSGPWGRILIISIS